MVTEAGLYQNCQGILIIRWCGPAKNVGFDHFLHPKHLKFIGTAFHEFHQHNARNLWLLCQRCQPSQSRRKASHGIYKYIRVL